MSNSIETSTFYQGKIEILDKKIKFLPEKTNVLLPIKISNLSKNHWESFKNNQKTPVNISYHWTNHHGDILVKDGIRTFLPEDISPGKSKIVEISIRYPKKTNNEELTLEIDLVHENVTWFSQMGFSTAKIKIKILKEIPYPILPKGHDDFVKYFDIVGNTENIKYHNEFNKTHISGEGWAGSIKYGAPLKNLTVHLDSNFLGNITLGIKRKDITENSNFICCGWKFKFDISKLEKGLHLLEIFSDTNHIIPFACRVFEINNSLSLISETNSLMEHELPPANLRKLVSGTTDAEWFIRSGILGRMTLERSLKTINHRIDNFQTILDFGCGCSRVLGYLQDFKKLKLFGVDYNNDLIQWSQKNLKSVKFYKNKVLPSLPFEKSKFEMIYSFSVFTHLSVDLQKKWLNELNRILKKGGILIISTHGKNYEKFLNEKERLDFNNGKIVVWETTEGSNEFMTFHPPNSLEMLLPAEMKVEKYFPEGALGNPFQDLYLIKKYN